MELRKNSVNCLQVDLIAPNWIQTWNDSLLTKSCKRLWMIYRRLSYLVVCPIRLLRLFQIIIRYQKQNRRLKFTLYYAHCHIERLWYLCTMVRWVSVQVSQNFTTFLWYNQMSKFYWWSHLDEIAQYNIRSFDSTWPFHQFHWKKRPAKKLTSY